MAEDDPIGKAVAGLVARYRVADGEKFRIVDHATDDKAGLDKVTAKRFVKARKHHLAVLQENFAAARTRGIVVVLQGMDTAGKDSLIRHVMSGMNPQGTDVTSFKAPTSEEAAHDFLWRVHAAAPPRGKVGVFNRSHYEDVLVARVHAERLAMDGLPGDPTRPEFWDRRLEDIRHFEQYMTRQGFLFLKIFLHISFDEQRRRILRRLDRPEKRWKFDESDLVERQFWPRYQVAYEEAIRATATDDTPWLVVPSDHKWLSRLVTMEALIACLESLNPEPPPATSDLVRKIAEFRRALEKDTIVHPA
ncbi:PPK2 family polyphosphate kinase [Acidomonas methanolica]|uniref:PPK2 family polyphosphate kinase n=1 Tax=Acidomonas methanolica TaxID=437 RepID=UPI00211A7041|nr:PPK2 family polyphosphate kinase [Acidomonas methanolica]